MSEIAALVRTLYVFRIETLEDIAWAPLIQEMLSRKLDKLHLSTTFDRGSSYFEQFDTISTDCATALIEVSSKLESTERTKNYNFAGVAQNPEKIPFFDGVQGPIGRH